MSQLARPVAIVGGVRLPFARAYTAYAPFSNRELLGAVLRALVQRYGLEGQRLGDVGAGAVLKHSRDWNLARESVLDSGLDPETPAFDWQRACSTSLDTAVAIAGRIAGGEIDSGIAAGVDSVSDAPVVYPDEYRALLTASHRGRTTWQRMRPWLRFRPRHLRPVAPAVVEPRTGLSMGQSTELMAQRWEIDRLAQDELALTSHQRLAAACDAGFYDNLVIPHGGLSTDNNLRRDTSAEQLAALRPAFVMNGRGSLTPGNSTPLTDGAAAVLLATEAWARERSLPVLAWLTHSQVAAVEFTRRDGLLFAPALAVPRMLARAGLELEDLDFYEIHEAFAAQVLVTLRAWESEEFARERLGRDRPFGRVDRSRLNVKGGSIAIGHPFAATGAREVATLAKILATSGARRGLISICTAGGMGVAALLER